MSDPVTSGRHLDAELIGIVRLFQRRRKWRHILAMIVGGVLLVCGSAFIAAHLTHRTLSNTPSIGAGAGLYAAGALLFGWGAAAGFTARLAKWLPASIILGVLAVLVLVLAGLFAGETNDVFHNGNPDGNSSYRPVPPARVAKSTVSNRVLAAELLDQSEVARILGPVPAQLLTPGARVVRTRSLALWRAEPPAAAGPGSRSADARAARPPRPNSLSLVVQYSARKAHKLQTGYCPRGSRPTSGLVGGYVRVAAKFPGAVTRVRAGRGEWVVTLQLTARASDDPGWLLTAQVARVLDLLNAASSS